MRLSKLQCKDVVNVNDGAKIGFISDVEVNWCNGCIEALVIEKYSLFRILCFFRDPTCILVPIECVVSFGGDVILVSFES